MPRLDKKVISQYVRRGCKKQLRLLLSPDIDEYREERESEDMPEPHRPRPGLQYIREAGREWESEKTQELIDTFGPESVIYNKKYSQGKVNFKTVELEEHISSVGAGHFIVEGEFSVPKTFVDKNDLGELDLDYANVRPDLIQVLPPRTYEKYVHPSGRVEGIDDSEDDRLQLRVTDIKLTAEPNAAYYAEVAYYDMVLSAWLEEKGLADDFVVVADLSIWPGTYEGSSLLSAKRTAEREGRDPTTEELMKGLEDDLEFGPVTVFTSRLKDFFSEDLPDVLESNWTDLPWHVDHSCIGCEYLGKEIQNPDEDHCYRLAEETNDLSRVAYISEGASEALREEGIENVPELADRSADSEAFDKHQSLKAMRTVWSERAEALDSDSSQIPDEAGSSAVLPSYADLNIYLTIDFDVGSALSFAFGLKAAWYDEEEEEYKNWSHSYVIESRALDRERKELIKYLRKINEIFEYVYDREEKATYQIYIWDQVQYDHLTRVIGRHLPYILEDDDLDDLAWLFPPESVVKNPEYQSGPSPITLTSKVVQSLLAAPVAHVYSLLNVARVYHTDAADIQDPVSFFSVHPLYEDEFSSVIPSERAHEIWSDSGELSKKIERLDKLNETIEKRLRALDEVSSKLRGDLRSTLQRDAPEIPEAHRPQRVYGIGWDSQLWLKFARLNAALEKHEIESVRSMPPHEREARFKSALLSEMLTGDERDEALDILGLEDEDYLWIYNMDEGSNQVKLEEGDFDWCLAPNQDTSILDQNLGYTLSEAGVEDLIDYPHEGWKWNKNIDDATQVTIRGIDRENSLIAIKPTRSDYRVDLIDLLSTGIFDFGTDVSLEQVHLDFYTDRLERALGDIGNPEVQRDYSQVRQALGLQNARAQTTEHTPVAEVLWNADSLATISTDFKVEETKKDLQEHGISLNKSQWSAFEESLSRKLRLIWGPPGTGKSRTLRALTLGRVMEAQSENKSPRILICAGTYNAMDNILEEVYEKSKGIIDDSEVNFYRLRSTHKDSPDGVLDEIDTPVNRFDVSERLDELRYHLDENTGITVVGATPQQIHKLIRTWDEDSGQRELFDHIVVDEASQMDVGHSILAFASIASEGQLTVVGDPKQLSPIQEAEAPEGLESMVGSIYDYFKDIHEISENELTVNYRSNEEIVKFQRSAGYPRGLDAFAPDLQINLKHGINVPEPEEWPDELPWGEFVEGVLDPDKSCVAVTYQGGKDSQWNEFESGIVTSLVSALKSNLSDQLKGEKDPETGTVRPPSNSTYDSDGFWESGIGIVTPHKAQQETITEQLQKHCGEPGEGSKIRDAVDTVERFQGQQRDVIIASYAVSDPDLVEDEDEFLLGLNRFNVLQSRARAKVIVIVSEQIVNHLPQEVETLEESKLLKTYTNLFCDERTLVSISTPSGSQRSVEIKYHSEDGRSVEQIRERSINTNQSNISDWE